LFAYVVTHSIFKDKDIHTSFNLLQDNFIDELTQHNVDISMVVPAVKHYCEKYLSSSQKSSNLTTPGNLITWMKNLPYHNCLNLSVLEHCSINMGLRYLFEIIEEYKQTFFTKKFLDLFPSGECKDIQIEIPGNHFYVIKSRESNDALKEDITINELGDFSIYYRDETLFLYAKVAEPHGLILKGTNSKDELEVCLYT